MSTVTALETQKRNPHRVNVFLDGEFALGLSEAVIASGDLRVGHEVTAETLARLELEDAAEHAYAAALNFLSYRPRSKREVQDFLRRRKVGEGPSATVIERLMEATLLDDREFARYWVENRQTFRPSGSRALSYEMARKGVDRDIVEEALQLAGEQEELAYRAGLKKLRSLRGMEPREFQKKMVAFLVRRGFDFTVSNDVSKRLSAEAGTRGADM